MVCNGEGKEQSLGRCPSWVTENQGPGSSWNVPGALCVPACLAAMAGLESRLDSGRTQLGGGGLCCRQVRGCGVTVGLGVSMGVQAVVIAQPVLLQGGGEGQTREMEHAVPTGGK